MKTKKIFSTILSIFGWIILAFLFTLIIWNAADKFSGYSSAPFGTRISQIGSSSMEVIHPDRTDLPEDTQRIKKGDIIITKNVSRYEDLKLYDVITFYDGHYLICHRIVDLYESDGKQFIVTQGDANNVQDIPFDFSLVRGRVTGLMPTGLGNFVLFMSSGYGIMAILLSAGFICLGFFIYANVSKKDKQEPVQETPQKIENKPVLSEKNNVSTEPRSAQNEKTPQQKKVIKIYKFKCAKCGSYVDFKDGEDTAVCPNCGTTVKKAKKNEK